MKTKLFLLFLLSFGANLVFAQGENNNWYFGYRAAVNFANPAVPAVSYDSQMSAVEACGSVSDQKGDLLFYTNGMTIWNREHQQMQNGTGLSGTLSSQQLAIVQHPGNPNQYFVFTTADKTNGANNFIAYTIVDMSLGFTGSNGLPLGAVVQNAKNIKVLDNTGGTIYSEAVTIVPKASGTSYWVLIADNNKLYSYTLNNAGFSNGNPVLSGLNFPLSPYNYFGIKASPKINNPNYSRFICISIHAPEFDVRNKVLSFNDTTGQVTNDYSLVINGLQSYIPEFNKNASVLYLGSKSMYAVDLENSTQSNIIYKAVYNSTGTVFFDGIQRNKNGDIYYSHNQNRYYLGKIVNPDVYAGNISVNMNSIYLPNSTIGNQTSVGLPQLIEKAVADVYYPCTNNLVLNTAEINNDFVYNVGNNIVTEADYFISSDQRITMNAGNSITLLPNTHIMANRFVAKIVPCDRGASSRQGFQSNQNLKQTNMVLELDKEERSKFIKNDIKIFPNPVSDILMVNSDAAIETVEVFDMSGRKLSVSVNGNKIDVRNLSSGTYTINIKTKNGMISKQFIKK